MIKSLPNILTLSRIVVIPLIIFSFYIGDNKVAHVVSASLFLYACVTDFFDGYLARILSIQSSFGRFLDPIADKLLVGSVIVLLVYFRRADLLPSLAIIIREILVSGLREFLAELKVSVPVSNLAKVKTFLQMSAIFMILLGSKGSGISELDFIANITLWVASILTIFTGYIYLKASLVHITNEK